MTALLEDLLARLEAVAAALPAVTRKKMFGCEALFADGTIFALIWKTGRIGLKLPDAAAFEGLMALPGAAPWQAGEKVMGHWVLVPEAFHADEPALRGWAERAHALALAKAIAPAQKSRRSRSS